MLIENNDIDQLFRGKLEDYEKTPPAFLWTSIQGGLIARRRNHRIAILRTVGIAAAIVLAFIAGWQMTDSADKDTHRKNRAVKQEAINNHIDPLLNKNPLPDGIKSVDSNKASSIASALPQKQNRATTSKISSDTAFDPKTSSTVSNNSSSLQKQGEPSLAGTKKDLPDTFSPNSEKVKKPADLTMAERKDSVTDVSPDSKGIRFGSFGKTIVKEPVAIAFNNTVRNNNRWSLKAEFAPLFNSQSQNSAQRTDLLSLNSQNLKPQETKAENTFSGGMVAGYKVSKKLIVKSGFVYNNIRQTTRNIDFMGVNPMYNIPGNATIASTPAGQVSLSKVGNVSAQAVLDSKFQVDNTAKFATENELKQDIEFIEIPVQATYKLIDSKFNVGLTGGMSTNILVGNKAILSGNGERISSGETANMRSVVYSSAVGLEVGYEITRRISLTLEPRLKHFISSLSTNKSVNYKPTQMGIVTGLTYSFN